MLRALKGAIMVIVMLALAGLGAGGCARPNPIVPPLNNMKPVPLTVIRVHLEDVPVTLDPARATNWSERQLVNQMYDGLVGFTAGSSQIEPRLAERWEQSPDGLRYTFYLRQGVKFADGTIVTARDVKYSWERLAALDLPAATTRLLTGVQGYAERRQGQEIIGIKVIDDSILQVTLTSPDPDWLVRLTAPGLQIVNRLVVETWGNSFGQPGSFLRQASPGAGTGPLSLVEWVGQEIITLENNPYREQNETVQRWEFYPLPEANTAYSLYLAGKLDLALGLPVALTRELTANPAYHSQGVAASWGGPWVMRLNPQLAPLDQQTVRWAIVQAVDRQRLQQELGAEGNTSWRLLDTITPGMPLLAVPPADIDHARGVLAESGPLPGDQEIRLAYLNDAPARIMAAFVRDRLAEVGLTVQLIPLERRLLDDMWNRGAVHMIITRHDPLFPDFWLDFDWRYRPGGGVTEAGAVVVRELMERARTAQDKNERTSFYQAAGQQLIQHAMVLPLVQGETAGLLAGRFENFIRNQLGLIEFHRISSSS